MKLYHYTTLEAFQGIIKNNELWLTERNCMGDIDDELYIKNIVKDILNPNDSPYFKGSLIDERSISDKPQYVFSTSTEKDSVFLWSVYGKDSPICVEFDKDELEKYFIKFSSSDCKIGNRLFSNDLFSSLVEYGKDDDKLKQIILEWKNEQIKETHNLISPPSEQHYNAHREFHKHYSFVKKEKFSSENEYRFLIYSKIEPDFRERGDSLISFLKVNIERKHDCKDNNENKCYDKSKKHIKLPITGVIISPYTKDESNIKTVKKFLEKYKYDNVAVSLSALHLRK